MMFDGEKKGWWGEVGRRLYSSEFKWTVLKGRYRGGEAEQEEEEEAVGSFFRLLLV